MARLPRSPRIPIASGSRGTVIPALDGSSQPFRRLPFYRHAWVPYRRRTST